MPLSTVFAARLLKQSIVDSVVTKSGRGGTYLGATGCGKTYTMAFWHVSWHYAVQISQR